MAVAADQMLQAGADERSAQGTEHTAAGSSSSRSRCAAAATLRAAAATSIATLWDLYMQGHPAVICAAV